MLHPKTIESIEDFFNKNTIETKALQEALTNVSQVHIDYDTSYNYENLTFRFKESNARVEITPESNNYYLLNVYGSEGYNSCCLKQASQDVDESKISGFSHQIEDLKIYDSQDSTSIRFKLGDKEISIETRGENYSIWVDGKHLDSYPDGKYIAAELEELANKLELDEPITQNDFTVE